MIIYRNTVDVCILTLYSVTVLEILLLWWLFSKIIGIICVKQRIMLSKNEDVYLTFQSILLIFYWEPFLILEGSIQCFTLLIVTLKNVIEFFFHVHHFELIFVTIVRFRFIFLFSHLHVQFPHPCYILQMSFIMLFPSILVSLVFIMSVLSDMFLCLFWQ